MDISVLITALTEGLPAEQAAIVKAAIERDQVKTKAGGWKQESDVADLQARSQALQAELEGDAANGKLGAREYQKWYTENSPAIAKLNKDIAAYKAKHGELDAAPGNPNPPTPGTPAAGLSALDIQREVDKRINEQYAPKWGSLLTGVGSVVQKHMLSGRKTEIDFKKLEELAAARGGDLMLAYDEYDRPERESTAKAATEAEIERRVKEEIQKRGASSSFPGGADMTPGSLTHRDSSNFSRSSMMNDLVKTFQSGELPVAS